MAEIEKLIGSESPLEVGLKINEIIEKGVGGTGLQMFDTILKDHVLTYEDSKGWALQGTYVYKEAIAGSRYGYPDFYNKVLEEKEASTTTEVTLGENTITMYVNSNGHQFYDIADLEVINTWFDTYGSAWFYGIDTENERVFLPRNNYFEQVTGDISEVSQSVEAGLPAHEHDFQVPQDTGSGGSLARGMYNGPGNSWQYWTTTGVIDDTGIYGNSDTVQPPAVKKLLYICVGNTEVTSTVTDVVEVTTTENDTTPLFTGMYFDFIPNNVSWLPKNTTTSGDVYTFTYNELVNELTSPKYNLKVINEGDMIAGVDYSEYWKVNQDDMTFTTPTKISYLPINADTVSVVGNGQTLGLTNGTNEGGLVNGSGGANVNSATLPCSVGTSATTALTPYNVTWGVVTDAEKSGLIADLSSGKSETAQLYFKVANAVQNLELLNAGEVLEAVADISVIAESKTGQPDYTNAISYDMGTAETATFTVPADGWIWIGISTWNSLVGGATINGYQVMSLKGTSKAYVETVCGTFFVKKGDVIVATNPYVGADCDAGYKFFPMKGVN